MIFGLHPAGRNAETHASLARPRVFAKRSSCALSHRCSDSRPPRGSGGLSAHRRSTSAYPCINRIDHARKTPSRKPAPKMLRTGAWRASAIRFAGKPGFPCARSGVDAADSRYGASSQPRISIGLHAGSRRSLFTGGRSSPHRIRATRATRSSEFRFGIVERFGASGFSRIGNVGLPSANGFPHTYLPPLGRARLFPKHPSSCKDCGCASSPCSRKRRAPRLPRVSSCPRAAGPGSPPRAA